MICNVVEPKILSLITTDKCTAACRNCCFQCSPQLKQRMSLEQMKFWIDETVSDFPDVKSCVFTGGECTTLGVDLIKVLNYASCQELKTRIVTNAHWAIDEIKSLSYLKRLKDVGLDELNLSTGDEHQKWIPYDRIVYACLAAVQLNIFVAVNVESTRNSKFTSRQMKEDIRISKYIANGKIIVKDSLWIEFDATNDNSNVVDELNNGPCTNLFNTISISPDGHLYACCGLTCKGNRFLNVGDLQLHSLRQLYDEQFDDLIKIWLYTHGPKKIYTYLCEKKGLDNDSYKYSHICSLCHRVLMEERNMDIIKSDIHNILPSIMLKYQFINNLKL